MSEARHLTDLIGSRICHDLISPIGAIGNGLELLALSGLDDSPEFGLVNDSVASANAQIRFFRVAFGLARPDARIGRPEIAEIIDDTYRGGRVSVVWRPAGDVARTEAKRAFLALMCIESALPRGGEITIDRSATDWSAIAEAERFNIETALWEGLERPEGPVVERPSQAQFLLLFALGRESGRPLSVRRGDGTLSLRF